MGFNGTLRWIARNKKFTRKVMKAADRQTVGNSMIGRWKKVQCPTLEADNTAGILKKENQNPSRSESLFLYFFGEGCVRAQVSTQALSPMPEAGK